MDMCVSIINIIISVVVVHFCKEYIGKWFYYFVVLTAFGLHNLFGELTNSMYISLIDIYLDKDEVAIIYYGVLVASTLIIMVVCREKQTSKSLIKCVCMPLSVIYLFDTDYPVIWIIAILVIVLLLVVFIMYALKYVYHSNKNTKKIIRRLRKYIHITYRRVIKVIVIAVVCCAVITAFDRYLFSNKVTADTSYNIKYRIVDDTLINGASMYSTMTTEERFRFLKDISKIEIQFLGIQSDCKISLKDLPEGTNGWFDKTRSVIAIDEDLIENAELEEGLRTCLHEVYHLYQYELIGCSDWTGINTNLRLVNKICQWKYDYENYKSAESAGYEAYANQTLELDASNYAKKTIAIYMSLLSKNAN